MKKCRRNNIMEELDRVELETEEGEVISLYVARYFYYNGDEYVLLCEDEAPTIDSTHYIMKVEVSQGDDDEEMEEFLPIEDEALMETLTNALQSIMAESEDE